MPERWLSFIFLILTENCLVFASLEWSLAETQIGIQKDKRTDLKFPESKSIKSRTKFNNITRTLDSIERYSSNRKDLSLSAGMTENFNGDSPKGEDKRTKMDVQITGRTILPFGLEALALLMAKAFLISFISIVVSAMMGLKSGKHYHEYSNHIPINHPIYHHSHGAANYKNQESDYHHNNELPESYQHHINYNPEDQNRNPLGVQDGALLANPIALHSGFRRKISDAY